MDRGQFIGVFCKKSEIFSDLVLTFVSGYGTMPAEGREAGTVSDVKPKDDISS